MCKCSMKCFLFSILDGILNDTATEGSIRLSNGSGPHKGRVEVFLFGHWGTVCDYRWDLADATVVCHQLGYMRAVEAPRSAAFGAGSGPSWYSNVWCRGTEMNLAECYKYDYSSKFRQDCSHSQDAGVVCSSKSKSTCCVSHTFFETCSLLVSKKWPWCRSSKKERTATSQGQTHGIALS